MPRRYPAEFRQRAVELVRSGRPVIEVARLLEVKPGFTTENALTMQLGLPNASYQQPQKRIAFFQQLEAGLKAAPEVSAVGFVTRLPLMSALNNITTFLSILSRIASVGLRS